MAELIIMLGWGASTEWGHGHEKVSYEIKDVLNHDEKHDGGGDDVDKD